MTKKRRSAQAIAAWGRHAGAHDPGSKPHEPRWTVEGEGYIIIDGELIEIELDWEGDDDEEAETEEETDE